MCVLQSKYHIIGGTGVQVCVRYPYVGAYTPLGYPPRDCCKFRHPARRARNLRIGCTQLTGRVIRITKRSTVHVADPEAEIYEEWTRVLLPVRWPGFQW